MDHMEYLADRTALRITGREKENFLQHLITRDITSLTRKNPLFSALLTPQGKIISDFFIYLRPDSLVLECSTETTGLLVAKLRFYRLRADVEITPDDTLNVFVSSSPFTINHMDALPDPRHPSNGWRLPAEAPATDTGQEHYTLRCLENGIPECGRDFGPEQHYLTDVNYDLLNGVSYDKGCFTGQEVTSRMKRKGTVRKRTLAGMYPEGAPPPAAGTPVIADGQEIGSIQGAGKNRFLALIRIDRWQAAEAAGAEITAAGQNIRLSWPDYFPE